jgi:SNF2 family DNA or RNA helicase
LVGKTCAVLALVAANPSAAAAPTADQIQTIRTNRSKLGQLKAPAFDFELSSKMGFDKYMKQHGEAKKAHDAQVKALLPWHSADFYAAGDSKAPQRPKLKTTVVFTSVSLLGQWEDECARHAPGLVVRRFHPTSKGKTAKFLDESQTTANPPDVIISTTTFSWPDWTKDYEFHRIVVDESHLFGTASAKRNYAEAVPSLRRWCCTATPMSMSAASISSQAGFLGRQDIWLEATNFDCKRPGSFAAFKDKLAPIFIRHTKAQRIGGSCALALPASVARTVTLTMSADERALYDIELQTASASKRTSLRRLARHGGKRYELERCLGNFLVSAANSYSDAHPAPTLPPFQRMHVATKRPGRKEEWNLRPEKSSKLVALRADLANLRRRDASCHAVVFTAYNRLHKAACAALRDDGFVVCEFTGGTSANDRDKHIRTFQSGLGKRGAPATVFVITTRSGNVGITLTAATRVYLMEPMLDPGTEVQAAGRIHRLGQTKDVLVTRFCFKGTVEEDIVKLHAKIAAGDIALSDSHFPAAGVKILMPPFEAPKAKRKQQFLNTSSSKGCAQS